MPIKVKKKDEQLLTYNLLKVLTDRDSEERKRLKKDLIALISPYIKTQNNHRYIEVADIEEILPSDPLEMARTMIEEHNSVAPDNKRIKGDDLESAEVALGLINIHYQALMHEIVSEINFDLDRETGYKASRELIEARGYKAIYDEEVMISESSSVRDLEYLKSINSDLIDLEINGENINYKVRYGNVIFYNDNDGTMIHFSGRKDEFYSPSVMLRGETNKYPNKDRTIQASSTPVSYQEAFGISLDKNLLFYRIEKMLDLGVRFNKRWHNFNDYAFNFNNNGETVSSNTVIEKIRKSHPEVLDNMIRGNSEILSVPELGDAVFSDNYIDGDCDIRKILEIAKMIGDEDLEDIAIRARLFDTKYCCKDKTGRYSDKLICDLKSSGLDEKEIERYYSAFIKEAESREITFEKVMDGNQDKIIKIVESFNDKEKKLFLKVHERHSSINKDLILKLRKKAEVNSGRNKSKILH